MPGRKRTASQARWLKEHFSDPFVKQAQKQGLRSRASFKLQEILQRHRLINKGEVVVDLGAAPGGWSEYAVTKAAPTGRVVATDILPMSPIAGVEFVQGDFREERVFEELIGHIGPAGAQVVLSDMAPNLSGNKAIDQPRCMLLSELALEMARRILSPGGALVVKVFVGAGFEEFLALIKQCFAAVKVNKPEASRDRSREVYVVATGFKPETRLQPPGAAADDTTAQDDEGAGADNGALF